jgi:hypothetical protein
MSGAALALPDNLGFEQNFGAFDFADWSPRITVADSASSGIAVLGEVRKKHIRVRDRYSKFAPADFQRRLDQIYPAVQDLIQLSELPDGWNSYRAKKIDKANIAAALLFLLNHLTPESSLPHVVPTVRGGVQLEWHTLNGDIEVYISGSTDISFFADTLCSDGEFEGIIPQDESKLRHFLANI